MTVHVGSAAIGLVAGAVCCMAGAWIKGKVDRARNRRARIRDIEADIEADLRRRGTPMTAKEYRKAQTNEMARLWGIKR